MIRLSRLLILCCITIIAPLPGCFPKYIAYPGIQKIADERGVTGMTDWALNQSDATTILQVLYVIRNRALRRLDEAELLMDSYKTIMMKLEADWPGLEGPHIRRGSNQTLRDRLLELGYERLARSATHESAPSEMRQAYFDLRPPNSRQPQYSYWINYAQQYGLLGE